ncbi:MAG: RpiB/LacA/LacB family sugar-phosphate isomerase [Planctomycetota bacterium]|nr:RpiB/LacA/LacB family sugar-phosphate isomerase [Planctomycetota bacterium]
MDAELVNKVVEHVIEALGRQGNATQPEASPIDTPKLTERNPSVCFPSEDKPTDSYPSALGIRPPPKVFITAEVLQQRLTGSKGGVIELAANEFLTPAAADLADTKNLTISKADPPSPGPLQEGLKTEIPEEPKADSSQTPNSTTVGLVINRPGEKTDSVVYSLAGSGIKFSRFDESSCWMENLRSMCRNVASGALTGGVAVMPYAADAMVLANKIDGIRAVQGTRIESVKAGLRRFGANVLILEHVFSTFHEMCTMIRAFTNGRGDRAVSGLLLEAIGREETS